ncbi:MAG: FHA domain-containing protein [Planctomycetes bacterium]|nr:FHA domain-containing protein [Planctomycetota bacterium]
MFNVHEMLGRWRSGGRKGYRLAPLDGWVNDGRPVSVHPPAVVGRSERADVHLTDPWVSRIHCVISERDGELVVRDLESRHGVYVNEERVSQGTLHPGDTVLIGASRFRVEVDADDAELS